MFAVSGSTLMDRNGFMAVFLLLFLIVADVSDASLLSNLRKLVGVAPKDNSIVRPVLLILCLSMELIMF